MNTLTPYEFTQTRQGFCKCGNELKEIIHYQFQINDGETYCVKCNSWTKTKFLEVLK
jgi:hypothetical protein